jgi:hypothetical protein
MTTPGRILPDSELCWEDARGGIRLVHEAEHVERIVMRGHARAEQGERLAAALNASLKRGKRHTFWDLEELDRYDSQVRVLATQALLDHRSHVVCVKVLAKSKIVRMGVAVANLTLGGIIENLDTRLLFERALSHAVVRG